MLDTLINAIRNRMVIEFTYTGIRRIGLPAAVGVSRNGKTVLCIYQTGGEHNTPGHDWNLCLVDELSDVVVTKDTFLEDPPNYRKGDKRMVEIYAEL